MSQIPLIMWRISDSLETRPPQHVLLNMVAVAQKGVSREVPHFRSTSKSRSNNIRGGKCPFVPTSVRPSTKSFFDLNEIWYIGRGR